MVRTWSCGRNRGRNRRYKFIYPPMRMSLIVGFRGGQILNIRLDRTLRIRSLLSSMQFTTLIKTDHKGMGLHWTCFHISIFNAFELLRCRVGNFNLDTGPERLTSAETLAALRRKQPKSNPTFYREIVCLGRIIEELDEEFSQDIEDAPVDVVSNLVASRLTCGRRLY